MPLFSPFKEAIQLADFEVDTLKLFRIYIMETDMPKEQVQSLMAFRENSIAAKKFVGDLINLLEKKLSIQSLIEIYVKGYFLNVLFYIEPNWRKKRYAH